MPVGTVASAVTYAGIQMQVTAMSTGIGVVCLPCLSCELLNSWNPMLSEVAARLGQPQRSPWTYLSCSIQVLFVFAGVAVGTVAFPVFSFVFTDAPVFLFGSLKAAGLVCLDGDQLTEILIQIGCYLFDVTIYAACLSSLGFPVIENFSFSLLQK